MGAKITARSCFDDSFAKFSQSFRDFFSKTLARKFFRKTDLVDAINLVQKSSKSELSSRFLSRSKFWGAKKVEFSKGRLPPEDGSVRPQTLGKRVSDDPRHFIFRRRKTNFEPPKPCTPPPPKNPHDRGFRPERGGERKGRGKITPTHRTPGVGGFF